MSRPNELVCDGRYLAHDWMKGPAFWLCLCCDKKRNSRRKLTPNEWRTWKAYLAWLKAKRSAEHIPVTTTTKPEGSGDA